MKKVESNNKGFTLIELLVVIAIMASILVLSITSLNGISKKKKEEAKKKVEDQIILAAKQYFNSNEYLFEALDENYNATSKICLGELVESDYINTLTDPTTNKKFDKEDYIEITKTGNKKYSYKYKKKDSTCDMASITTIVYNPGGNHMPDPNVKYYNKEEQEIYANDEGWFNIASFNITNTNSDEISSDNRFNSTIRQQEGEEENPKTIKVCVSENNSSLTISNLNIYGENIDPNVRCYSKEDDFNKEIRNIIINYGPSSKVNSLILTDNVGKDTISPTIDIAPTLPATKPEFITFKIKEINNKYQNLNTFQQLSLYTSMDYMYAYISDTTSGIKKREIDGADYLADTVFRIGDIHNIMVEDNAGNISYNNLKKDAYEKCRFKSEPTIIKENGTCNCETRTKTINKQSVEYDFADSEYICSIENAGTEEESCECQNPPLITVKVYKIDSNKNKNGYYADDSTTNKGTPILIRSFSGDSTSNIININNGSWMNSIDFPGGVYIEYFSDVDLTRRVWHWNKSNLDISDADSNSYKWNDSSGFNNGSYNDYESLSKGTLFGHPLSAEGVRKAVISVASSGGITKIYISAKMDRTPPNIENITYPTKRTDYCSGNSIYTNFKVTDKISKVYQVNHFLEDQPYYAPTAANIVIPNSLYSVREGKADNTTTTGGKYMNYFNNSTTSIENGFSIKRAWVNGSISDARNKKCGTKANNVPNITGWKNYCNYVSARDTAGNIKSAALCADSTEYYHNY